MDIISNFSTMKKWWPKIISSPKSNGVFNFIKSVYTDYDGNISGKYIEYSIDWMDEQEFKIFTDILSYLSTVPRAH